MNATRRLLQHRQPLIQFVGRRHQIPQKIDHAPHPHPASASDSLPESFASYREKATQHGPLKGSGQQHQRHQQQTTSSSAVAASSPSGASTIPEEHPWGAIGSKSAKELGPIKPGKDEFMDRSELPARFHRTPWTQAEIDAVESGGASAFV